ncbi:hypothetical protein ACHAWF_018680 [Thalassiosira exigua]
MYGFINDRWAKCLDIMLEKKPGVRKIHHLRIIGLVEVDFNTALKLYFDKHLTGRGGEDVDAAVVDRTLLHRHSSPPRTSLRPPRLEARDGDGADDVKRGDDERGDDERGDDERGDDVPPLGLYVHVPYCRRRCHYCDLAIVPVGSGAGVGDGRAASDDRDDVGLLGENAGPIREGGREGGRKGPGRGGPEPKIRWGSVYFGGRTPSLPPLETLRGVMRRSRARGRDVMATRNTQAAKASSGSSFRLEDDAEVTIEMDPGTFDRPYLKSVKDMGFNRISLGVQSFDDDVLVNMGWVHRTADVRRS